MGLPRVFSKPGVPGVAEGTLVATSQGWRPIETLAPGDQIWTFDDGLQTLLGVKRRVVKPQKEGRRPNAPFVVIPADALGNERDIICTACAGILLECENAMDPMGEPYAVLPTSSLVGSCDVEPYEITRPIAVFTLQLSNEQAVYLDSGLPFHFLGLRNTETPRYDVLSADEAQDLLTEADVDELALREPYEEFFTQFFADRA